MLPCIRDDDEATLVLNTSEGLALAIILLRRAASASVARPMPSRSISKLTLKNMEVLALGIESRLGTAGICVGCSNVERHLARADDKK
jgi:hypothetical protein